MFPTPVDNSVDKLTLGGSTYPHSPQVYPQTYPQPVDKFTITSAPPLSSDTCHMPMGTPVLEHAYTPSCQVIRVTSATPIVRDVTDDTFA
jgi:hypothetical protein